MFLEVISSEHLPEAVQLKVTGFVKLLCLLFPLHSVSYLHSLSLLFPPSLYLFPYPSFYCVTGISVEAE